MYRFFTKEEKDFLKENYPKYGMEYCCIHLNTSKGKIINQCRSLRLKLNPEVKQAVVSKTNQKIWMDRFFKKQDKEYREFESIFLSPEVIYFLGFFWGDGSVENANNRIALVIGEKDGKNLKKIFKKVLPFKIRIRLKHKNDPTRQNCMDFSYTNKFLRDFLISKNYDIKSGASADKILNYIPKHLRHYWWRGFSDADGCFYISSTQRHFNYSISSVYDQNWDFKETLEQALGIKFDVHRSIRKAGRTSIINLKKIDYILKFRNYIYQNYENDRIGLKRKYLKSIKISYENLDERPAKQKINKTTGFIGVYTNRKRYYANITRNKLDYRFYSSDKNKVIEMYDRIALVMYPESYKLNYPEKENEYVKKNLEENPINLFRIRENN